MMKTIYCCLMFVVCMKLTHVYGQTNECYNILPAGCIEIRPQFPGGSAAIQHIARDSARWNKEEMRAGACDTVIIHFAVDTCGEPMRITVYKRASAWMNEEAVRLVRLLRGWTPGTLNGRKIVLYVSQPFVFKRAQTSFLIPLSTIN